MAIPYRSVTINLPSWDELRDVQVGVDCGQSKDPTAIVVSQREHEEDRYTVRYAQRLPLGTPYPKVGRVIAGIVSQLREEDEQFARWARLTKSMRAESERHDKPRKWDKDELARYAAYPRRVSVRVDATGVGRPVVDLLADALAGMDAELMAVTLTGSDQYNVRRNSGRVEEVSCGKVYLVSRLQALLQTRMITMPDTEESRALVDELNTYELRVNDNAQLQTGAFGSMQHDDLATALGMAVLEPSDRGGFEVLDNPFNDMSDGASAYWTDYRDAPTHDPLGKEEVY